MTNIVSSHKREKKQQNAISCRIKKSSRIFVVYSLISIMILMSSSNWTLANSNAQTDLDPAFQDSYWTDDNTISSSNTSTMMQSRRKWVLEKVQLRLQSSLLTRRVRILRL